MGLVDLGGIAQADPLVLGSLRERYALEMDPAASPASSSALAYGSLSSRS